MTRRRGKEGHVPLTPAFLVAAAVSWVGQRADHLAGHGNTPDAAFVNHVGFQSHVWGGALYRSRWPVPFSMNAQELAQRALKAGWLTTDPLEGDIVLVWSALETRFARVGIVSRVVERKRPLGAGLRDRCEVVSAEPTGSGSVWVVKRAVMTCAPCDRFVRWAPPARIDPEIAYEIVMEREEALGENDREAA